MNRTSRILELLEKHARSINSQDRAKVELTELHSRVENGVVSNDLEFYLEKAHELYKHKAEVKSIQSDILNIMEALSPAPKISDVATLASLPLPDIANAATSASKPQSIVDNKEGLEFYRLKDMGFYAFVRALRYNLDISIKRSNVQFDRASRTAFVAISLDHTRHIQDDNLTKSENFKRSFGESARVKITSK